MGESAQATSPWADLEEQIEHAGAPRRPAFRRRLKGLRRRARKGQPFDRGLARLRRAVEADAARRTARAARHPLAPTYPSELPVSDARERLLAAIAEHPVVVVCGDTGSGKTTQLPKMCLELGRGLEGRIGHTQPRRIAARSVADRIAEELGETTGETVGWQVRFNERVGDATAVKLMTDGILLAEIRHDPDLSAYDTIIIDEAHERSLNIDFLLGYLKRLLARRSDLRLIITSATIDPERFSRHFGDAPVIDVEGRTYPVEIRYRPLEAASDDDHELDRESAIVEGVRECISEGPGDVLVFLPGERAIRDAAEALGRAGLRDTEILPLYGRLSAGEQQRVFRTGGRRRIVLATNVAETSLTVPGIRYVIDPGEARISRYSVRSKVQRLPVEKVSQASADQRAGRCGRIGPGVCIRLYSEDDYLARPRFTDPEIRRTNLAAVVLQMASLGLGAVEQFPFIDRPERRLINDGYTVLFELGAVDPERKLTERGEQIARLAVDPRLARMLLEARTEGVIDELLVLAAALTIQDPRERPAEARGAADTAHNAFRDARSDFTSLLNLWAFWQSQRGKQSQNRLRRIAREHFLSFVRMREWVDLHGQLRGQMEELGLLPAGGGDATAVTGEPDDTRSAAVHRAVLSGLLGNVARHEGGGEYTATRNRRIYIFPGSGVVRTRPKWLVAAEISETSRVFARTVAAIERAWIERLGAHLLRRSYSNPRWQARAERVAADEQTTLYGLVINPRRRVNYGSIAAAESRTIFIRDALVGGEFKRDADFLAHNRALLAEVEGLEERARRRDIAVEPETLIAFYEAQLPADVHDGPTFDRWYRDLEATARERLKLTQSDLMQRPADEVTAGAYPDQLDFAGLRLPLAYRFEPGHEADGVTLTVPRAAIRQIPPGRCDWLVPGLRVEKIEALIRSLPKPWRRRFVPAPDFARALAARLVPDEQPLTAAMAAELEAMTGDAPPPDAWQPEQLPPHLHMRFRVIDEEGNTVDTSRDLVALAERHGDAANAEISAADSGFERDDVREWDFGALPESAEIERHGIVMQVHPALEPVRSGVRLTAFGTAAEAVIAHRRGVRALIRLRLAGQLRDLERGLDGLNRVALHFGTRIDGKRFTADLVEAVIDAAFLADAPLPRDGDGFDALLEAGRPRLWSTAEALIAELDRIGERYRAVRREIEGNLPMTWIETARDIADQLDHLVFPGFITATPPAWRTEVPRYLDAVARRLERLDREPEKDRRGRAEVAPLWEQVKAVLPPLGGIGHAPEAVATLRWMIEELRVSLFAQHLGTRIPVSPGRVEKQLEIVKRNADA